MGLGWEAHPVTGEGLDNSDHHNNMYDSAGVLKSMAGEKVPSRELAEPQPQGTGGTRLPRWQSSLGAGRRGLWGREPSPLETTHPPQVQLFLGAKVDTRHVPSQCQL